MTFKTNKAHGNHRENNLIIYSDNMTDKNLISKWKKKPRRRCKAQPFEVKMQQETRNLYRVTHEHIQGENSYHHAEVSSKDDLFLKLFQKKSAVEAGILYLSAQNV